LLKIFSLAQKNPLLNRMITLARKNRFLARVMDYALANAKEVERFIKFAIVGTSGAVVDFGILNFCILVLGFCKPLANTCSFSMAVLNNFIWNRLWTFPESRDRPFLPQLAQFTIVNIGGYILNQTIFLGLDYLILHRFGVLGYNLSKAIATIVVLFWNFGVNRIWTFRGI